VAAARYSSAFDLRTHNKFSMYNNFTARYFSTVQKVPTMGDSISEGTIETFVKNVGDFVEADEVVARIETDKVTVDILSTHAGVITKYYAEEGDNIEVGANFLEIDTDAKGSAAPAAPKKEEPVPAKTETAPTPAPKKDATPPPVAPSQKAPSTKQTSSQTAKKVPTEINGTRVETRVKMNKMRLTIARRLKESQNTAASLTTFNEIDMSYFMDARKEVQDAF